MSRAGISFVIFVSIFINLSCVNTSEVYVTFDGERFHIDKENKHHPGIPDSNHRKEDFFNLVNEHKDVVKEISVPLVSLSHNSKPVAWATFENAINQTGWAYLEVYTSDYYNDSMQAYAAGLAEGYITRDLISMHWMNTYEGYCKTPLTSYCQKLQQFLQDNLNWMTEQLAKNEAYWHHVGLTLDQLSGLTDGYKNQPGRPTHQIDVTGLLLLQLSGDLEDLSVVLTGERIISPVGGHGHCSALIKVLSGNSDLYVSQDTWDGLNSMLRIQKKYDFNWHLTADPNSEMIPGKKMTFSSYPGLLSSGDDFYVISSGLVTQETTIGNSNAARWKFVQPRLSVMEGTRAMVANRLASTGAEWVNLFSIYNSGTYNNQWMVVNYNIFKPGQPLSDGLFYVLEQIPGMIVKEDRTEFLRQNSYWPSFNIASFPKIFNASGQWDSVDKYGDWFTWEKSPRAQIFRRDHGSVTDLDSMTRIMRYNNFKNDPLSRCNCTPPYSGENAISARCDLNPANGTYPFSALGHRNHAGTDMKLTSNELMKSLQFKAISGPTSDDLPPFQWSKSDYKVSVSHVGHPDLWQFEAVIHKWGTI